MVGYNAQSVVDAKYKLIAAADVTNEATDVRQLGSMAIQAKEKCGVAKLKIPVKVVNVPDPNTLEVAVSDDNQAANKTDMRITMEKPMTKPPAPGAAIDIIGVISEFVPDPFMFTMTKGELPAVKPAAHTPAKKGAAGKKTTKKKTR